MNPPWVDAAWAGWARRVAAGCVPHAVLLAGPAGLGKRALAADIAGGLLCGSPSADGRPCGRCRACGLVAAGTHPDLHRITFEVNEDTGKLRTEIVVDQVRALRDTLAQTSQFGGWRVALIEPAEGMNTASFNALLKTLEEPEARALLLLVSDRPAALPATIRSRCQRIEFHPPGRTEARAWLAGQGHDAARADDALDAAGGHPGLADAWLRGGQLALREATLRDWAGVARGQLAPLGVAQSWTSEVDTLPLRLRFVADTAAALARAAAGAPAPVGLTPPDDVAKLGAWFDQLNVLRQQLAAPLRHDLALAGLLAEWRTLMARKETSR